MKLNVTYRSMTGDNVIKPLSGWTAPARYSLLARRKRAHIRVAGRRLAAGRSKGPTARWESDRKTAIIV
jgi:hypothetical protein